MFRLYFGETTKINFIYFKHIFVIASRVTMNQSKLFLSQRKLALNLVYEIIFFTSAYNLHIWGFEALEW